MKFSIGTPPVDSIHRPMFEDAMRQRDFDKASLVSVGGRIEGVIKQLGSLAAGGEHADRLFATYQQLYRPGLAAYVDEQTDQLYKSHTDFAFCGRRVALYGTLLDQMVLVPLLYTDRSAESIAIRRKLTQEEGIYGLIAMSLEDLLKDNEELAGEIEQQSFGVGQITENTGLGLVNLPQSPNLIGLPTLPFTDMKRKIDARIYDMRKQPVVHSLQFKTNDDLKFIETLRKNVLMIGGKALGNGPYSNWWPETTERYQTARAIVAENEGAVKDQAKQTLDIISRRLIETITSNKHFVERLTTRHRRNRPPLKSAETSKQAV